MGPVTTDRLGEPGLLATRNAHLMRLLEDLAAEEGRVVCENRGTGITAMLEALRTAGIEPPRFDDRHTTFRLTFSNKFARRSHIGLVEPLCGLQPE